MAANPLSCSLADFPAEMLAAVKADAARDADLVGLFLYASGIRATPERPVPLPVQFLFHLRAGLRLFLWEAQGFFFHREVGLPEAREVIRDAFRSLADPDTDPTQLSLTVLRLSVERFAWNGWRVLGADVALSDVIEEAALDALAEYLWASRHAAPATASSQP